MKFDDFVIAESLEEASTALKELGDAAYPVAGGTAFQYLSDRRGVTAVDISRLDLGGIEPVDGGFKIGALATLTELVRYRADGWVLDQVATLIPTHQIRNISTVGGNISRLFPWSEIPLGLLTLEAEISIAGDGERTLPAESFFDGQPSKHLNPGELVTAVTVPAVKSPIGFGYKKESVSNSAFGLMVAAVAVHLDGDTLKRVRVAVGSAVPVPQRLTAVEQALEGKSLGDASLQDAIDAGTANVGWKGREGSTDEFAGHLAQVIVRDALDTAIASAKGEQA